MQKIYSTIFVIAISIIFFNQTVTAQCAQFEQACSSSCGGPGTEMTQIINRFGLGSDCGRCKSLAAEMDRGGPQWVMDNFNCVTSRTISNAENLGHRMGPIRRIGVRAIVRTAVRRSR